MKIKIKQTAAGPDGVFHAGQIVNLSDEVAVMWLKAGAAEAVKEAVIPVEFAKEEIAAKTEVAAEAKKPEVKKRGRK